MAHDSVRKLSVQHCSKLRAELTQIGSRKTQGNVKKCIQTSCSPSFICWGCILCKVCIQRTCPAHIGGCICSFCTRQPHHISKGGGRGAIQQPNSCQERHLAYGRCMPVSACRHHQSICSALPELGASPFTHIDCTLHSTPS